MFPASDKLCLQCPGESSDHQHLPWGRISRFRYATSEETAYPLPLCRTMAQLLLRELTEKGYRPPPRSLADPLLNLHHAAQVSAGAQPRGKRVPPMVSEFRTIVSVDSNHDFLPRGTRLEASLPLPVDATCDQAVSLLPAGSRILQRLHLGTDESTVSLETSKPVHTPSLSPHLRQPLDAAEKHAVACLSNSILSENDISELFVLLKSEKAARGSGSPDEFSWTSGLYHHANVTGIRKNFRSHPAVSQLLARFVTQRAPGHPFTSVLLARNLKGHVHVDGNNEPGVPNCILQLSDFQGGLWMECANGTVKCPDASQPHLLGNVVDYVDRRMIIDPSAKHCPMPWTGGNRDVLIAFTTKGLCSVTPMIKKELATCGFSIPLSSGAMCVDGIPNGLVLPSLPAGSPPGLGVKFRFVIGIPWTPEEFIEQALSSGHPRHMGESLPLDLRETIDRLAHESPEAIGSHRVSEMRKWVEKALELSDSEVEYKSALPDHCRATLAKKKILLFRDLLMEAEHTDMDIVKHMSQGFDLGGEIPSCPEFKAKRTSASMRLADLKQSACDVRRGIVNATRSSGNPEIDRGTYEATLDEVSRGWLTGPIPEEDLKPNSLVTRRFGVLQNNKIRPIDNYLESGLNSTASASDTITLHSADCIAAGLSYRLQHDNKCASHRLLLKSWDLHKAYKNLPLSDQALEDSYLSVFDPDLPGARLFHQKVLPFGSRHSVHGFCRVSLGLWKILVRLLWVHISVFFDDFVAAEIEPLAKLCDMAVSLAFSLLGWTTSSDKENPFGSIAKVLGLKINLEDARLGKIYMCNTESRQQELFDSISGVLERNFLNRKDGERLRGRLQFAEAQIAGKAAGLAYKQLTRFLCNGGGPLDDATKTALLMLRDRVNYGIPRCISANTLNSLHIYVDASCEGDKVGLGGVIINERGTRFGHFSEFAPPAVLAKVNPDSGNPIFEFECLAIYIALHLWHKLALGTNTVIFTDNEGALACHDKRRF